MKKILLILLAFTSFASFAQAEFPEGIALNGNASSVNTSKVVIQEPTTGNLNYINALDLPASTADKLKGYLSTGLIKNGAIAINGDPTKFNITAGIGIISNFDDPSNPISTIINFPAFTGVTPTYLTTGNITYVAINSTPAVVMQATPFTAIQRRDLIELGAVIHSNLTTINVINNLSSPTEAGTNQLHDLFDFIGALNLSGNVYSANGANLQLNKSAGIIGKRGVNFINNWKDPHRLSQAEALALTFRYRTQNGTEGSDRVNLDPTLYDLNNVYTAVPNNKFVIETAVTFQTGMTRILKSQQYYDDLQSAINAVLTRDFVIEPNSKENGIIRAYIIMRNTTTSLQNVADAKILEAQKFGGVASGGVALTLANILTALNYTPEDIANKQNSLAVDGANTKYPTVTAVNTGLALKANLASPTFTGIPLVPTATAGTNTLQAASTAFVSTADAGNVKLTGNQNIAGIKTLTNTGSSKINGLSLINNGTGSNVISLDNNSTGNGFELSNSGGGIGFKAVNTSGIGLYINSSAGQGLQIDNTSSGQGLQISNTSTGVAIKISSNSTGNNIQSNQTSTGTGFNYVGQNVGVNTFTVDKLGATIATSFINSTAPATNALLANGTTLAVAPITGGTGYIQNQNSSAQSANMWISGSGEFGSSVTASSFKVITPDPSTNYLIADYRNIAGYGIFLRSNTTASRGNNLELVATDYNFGSPITRKIADFNIDGSATFSSSVTATDYKISALNTAPASATATGTTGEIRITAGFIYVCIATNTWVRTALATW